MITDRENRLSSAQAVTTGTQYSTNSYDTADGSSIGDGEELLIVVNVGAAFTGGTSLTVNVVDSANADLSSPAVLASSGAVAEASLTAGKQVLRQRVPSNTQRYVGLQFVSVGTHSTGTIHANMVRDADTNRAYSFETGR
ncbi:MAG: Bbp16 family capsid cement protein [Sphingobium sp.]|uniref:Bbp16 family capsid cement protein n=1 Tax=Sphingobium sp. TaxID=1912891 RepID=UPI003BB219FA